MVISLSTIGPAPAVASSGRTAVSPGAGRVAPARPPSLRRAVRMAVGTLHRRLDRASGGRLGRSLRGVPVLQLTTTGRRTGRARTWPLCHLATAGMASPSRWRRRAPTPSSAQPRVTKPPT